MKKIIIKALMAYEGGDFIVTDELIEFIENMEDRDAKKLKTLRAEHKKLQKEFEQYKMESVKWSVEDFLGLEGWKITPEQAQEALEYMIRKHDCNNGITWETLEFFAEEAGAVKVEDKEDFEENFNIIEKPNAKIIFNTTGQEIYALDLRDNSDFYVNDGNHSLEEIQGLVDSGNFNFGTEKK